MSAGIVDVTIEPAQAADEAGIRQLLVQSALPHEDFAAHLAHYLVARSGSALIGAVGFELHGRDALVRSLAVAPAWRGDGLGGALFKRVEAAAQLASVENFYLLTMTAEKFFARRWFQRIARDQVPATVAATPEFQGLCPASAVCMTRPVHP